MDMSNTATFILTVLMAVLQLKLGKNFNHAKKT
jgi:hypothetical protein